MSLVQIIAEENSRLEPIPTGLPPVLKNLPGVRAIIFDLYGTLFISGAGEISTTSLEKNEEPLREILTQHFPQIQIPAETSLSESLRRLIIKENTLQREEGTEHPEVVIEELWKTVLSPYGDFTEDEILEIAVRYETAVNTTWPMPHLMEVLTYLKERDIQLGIISNAQFYTPLLFPALLGRSLEDLHFSPDLCLYSYEYRQAKPGTFLFKKLSERLQSRGISPEEVLYVGNDALNDVCPAHEVGFLTALFAGDERSLRLREEHNPPEPDAIITAVPQLRDLLG